MRKMMIGAAALAMLLGATPALAQQSSMKGGAMWTAARIAVEDGQMQNYMDYLTKSWMANQDYARSQGWDQDYARSQGWLLDYHILQSINPRDGEPNIILITRFKDMPSAAEAERRTDILNKRLGQDAHSAAAASGDRNKMRRQLGSVLYREMLRR